MIDFLCTLLNEQCLQYFFHFSAYNLTHMNFYELNALMDVVDVFFTFVIITRKIIIIPLHHTTNPNHSQILFDDFNGPVRFLCYVCEHNLIRRLVKDSMVECTYIVTPYRYRQIFHVWKYKRE